MSVKSRTELEAEFQEGYKHGGQFEDLIDSHTNKVDDADEYGGPAAGNLGEIQLSNGAGELTAKETLSREKFGARAFQIGKPAGISFNQILIGPDVPTGPFTDVTDDYQNVEVDSNWPGNYCFLGFKEKWKGLLWYVGSVAAQKTNTWYFSTGVGAKQSFTPSVNTTGEAPYYWTFPGEISWEAQINTTLSPWKSAALYDGFQDLYWIVVSPNSTFPLGASPTVSTIRVLPLNRTPIEGSLKLNSSVEIKAVMGEVNMISDRDDAVTTQSSTKAFIRSTLRGGSGIKSLDTFDGKTVTWNEGRIVGIS
jgi:hypothetical protein